MTNNSFVAEKYFAKKIDRYITMKNTNPDAINAYMKKSFYSEFVNAKFTMDESVFSIKNNGDGEFHVEYIEDGFCYRKSRGKYQKTRVNVKVLMNADLKITFFRQYHIISNSYE